MTALEEGISPDTEFPSEQRTFHFGKHGGETFTVHNDEEGYLGSCSISCGLTYSDNSIYAGLGLEGLEGKTIGIPTGAAQFQQWPAFVKGCKLCTLRG